MELFAPLIKFLSPFMLQCKHLLCQQGGALLLLYSSCISVHHRNVLHLITTWWACPSYMLYITLVGVICLICTQEHEGVQRPRASADISGKSRLRMLYRQGWRFQLRHLEYNVVMTYIYTK